MTAAAITREERLLHGPVLPVLSRLALPNVIAMVSTVLVGIAETAYVGALGRDPLAAMALVFPLVMLMQTFSSGAMGGGVSSSIARALGAGDVAAARSLARHAVVIALVAGALFTLLFLAGGTALYRLLGAQGAVLEQAQRYGAVLFAGVSLIWIANTLVSIVRGTGNMVAAAAMTLGVSVVQIALGASLALGWGPFPRLGMAGVAAGQVIAFAGACVALVAFLWKVEDRVSLSREGWQLAWPRFREILRVGGVALLSPVQTIGAVLVMTALVSRLGVDALAGYGIGARLEFLMIPIAFGVGVATLPMVGMAVGRGDIARARRVAWTGGALAAAIVGTIGIAAAMWPQLWSTLFTSKPEVLQYAAVYLRNAAPAYVFFGLGITLYFSSQGAGRIVGPVLAGTLRLVVICLGGWLLVRANAPETSFFLLIGAGMVAHGLATVAAVWFTRWGR